MTTNGLTGDQAPTIYVLHENDEWVAPLESAFEELNLPYDFWFVNEGTLDLDATPPEGVFYNRMSASAHTRDHQYAIELSEPIVAWLEHHNRRVINGRQALNIEVRKAEQALGLKEFGIRTPKTVVVNNEHDLIEQAKGFPHAPFLVKPNRGGKGTGVELFESAADLENKIRNGTVNFHSLDGILLLQQYIKPATGHIVRLEFIGGQFYYAVQVDATGGFELCPADPCNEDENGDQFCPADSKSNGFKILQGYEDPMIPAYEDFLKMHDIKVGAIEYVENEAGERYVYDVNINTNYNSAAEAQAGPGYGGMMRIAEFLGETLKRAFQKSETQVN